MQSSSQPSVKLITPWALYYFAKSILIINGGLYFSQWLIVDNKVADFWYNIVMSATSVVVVFLGPLLGHYSDRRQKKVGPLTLMTILIFAFTITLVMSVHHVESRMLRVAIAIICFFGINCSYQLSLVVYNSMMGWLVPARLYARVSGVGLAAGWLGCILGLVLGVPFALGKLHVFAQPQRIDIFAPAAILFILLAAPSLWLMKDAHFTNNSDGVATPPAETQSLLFAIRSILADRQVLYFYIFFFCTCDALVTIEANIPIYFNQVLKLTDIQKISMLLLFFLMASAGAVIGGFMADALGVKKVLLGTTCILCLAIILMIAAPTLFWFSLAWAFVASLFGSVWALSRALLTLLVPEQRRGEYFGVYTAFDRVGGILGPVIWSSVLFFLAGDMSHRYKVALGAMTICLIPGLLFLRKVQLHRPMNNGGTTI